MRIRWRTSLAAVVALGMWGSATLLTACADQGPSAAEIEEMLQNPEDPDAMSVAPEVKAWLLQHRKSLHSLTSSDFVDLRFLAPLIGTKRLVLLGESHTARQDYQMKVRLVKYLHEELGFDVLAFEGGFYECWKTDLGIGVDANRANRLNAACLYGIWATDEVNELFEYLKQRRKTNRPLHIAGFDPQTVSGSLASPRGRYNLISKALGHLDDTLVARLAAADSTFIVFAYHRGPGATDAWLADNEAGIRADYATLRHLVGQHRARIDDNVPELHNAGMMLGRSLANAVAWLDLKQAGRLSLTDANDVRDSAMASNIDFIADSMYPGRKVMVWAHNHHVGNIPYQHHFWYLRSMGSLLAATRGQEMYTIGFYRYRGTPGNPGGEFFFVPPHEPGAIERILYHARRKYVFLDMLNARRSDSTEWMFTPINSNFDNGLTVFRDKYDAIIQIDSTSAALVRSIPVATPPLSGVPFQ